MVTIYKITSKTHFAVVKVMKRLTYDCPTVLKYYKSHENTILILISYVQCLAIYRQNLTSGSACAKR